MPVLKKLVTQGGNDTFTSVSVATGLTADGKAGWQINAVEAYWSDGSSAAAGDWLISAIVATESVVTTFDDDDEIARIDWGLQNTGGVAVAVSYEPFKGLGLAEPRVTVQPNIMLNVSSSNTGQANDMFFRLYYDVIKLTENEVLRLLAGGA